MNSIINLPKNIYSVELSKDLVRMVKSGHKWIFSGSINHRPNDKTGIYSLKYKNEIIAVGILQPESQLRFRVLFTCEEWFFKPNNLIKSLEIYADHNFKEVVLNRSYFDMNSTNSFRLINGEGDNYPGLNVDIYNSVAVIKLDHTYLENIWNSEILGKKIVEQYPQIQCVYFKRRNSEDEKGFNLIGDLEPETQFKENNLIFSSQIRDAAKTGFFLDQRDNRNFIRKFSYQKKVLNLFSYTGGFSIAAAVGGAAQVTSVDISKAAIHAVETNFKNNNLSTPRQNIAQDAFEYVKLALQEKKLFDIVIADPPSFAPNESSVPQAKSAYSKIYSDSIRLTKNGGYFAASSCSSHITHEDFFEILKDSFSKAKKNGKVIWVGSQPADHPFPLAMPEMRYLKFVFFQVQG